MPKSVSLEMVELDAKPRPGGISPRTRTSGMCLPEGLAMAGKDASCPYPGFVVTCCSRWSRALMDPWPHTPGSSHRLWSTLFASPQLLYISPHRKQPQEALIGAGGLGGSDWCGRRGRL